MLAQLAEPEVQTAPISMPAAPVVEPLLEQGDAVRGIAYGVLLSLPFWALVGFTFYLIM